MSDLIRDYWILMYLFNLLSYILLIEVYEENSALHNLQVEKKENFNSFVR